MEVKHRHNGATGSDELIIGCNKKELLKLQQMINKAIETCEFMESQEAIVVAGLNDGSIDENDAIGLRMSNRFHPATNYFVVDRKELKIGVESNV